MTITKNLLMVILFTMYWSWCYDDADHHQTGILIIIIQGRWPWSAAPYDDHRQSFDDHSITRWSSSQSDADNHPTSSAGPGKICLTLMIILVCWSSSKIRLTLGGGARQRVRLRTPEISCKKSSLSSFLSWSSSLLLLHDHHSYPILVAKTRNHHHRCSIIIIHTSTLFQWHEPNIVCGEFYLIGGENSNWGFEENIFIEPVQRFLIVNILYLVDVFGLQWTKERSSRLIENNVGPGCFCAFSCVKK